MCFQVKVWFQNRRTKLKRTVGDDGEEKTGDERSSTMTSSHDPDRSVSPDSFVESDFDMEEDDSNVDQNIDVV